MVPSPNSGESRVCRYSSMRSTSSSLLNCSVRGRPNLPMTPDLGKGRRAPQLAQPPCPTDGGGLKESRVRPHGGAGPRADCWMLRGQTSCAPQPVTQSDGSCHQAWAGPLLHAGQWGSWHRPPREPPGSIWKDTQPPVHNPTPGS